MRVVRASMLLMDDTDVYEAELTAMELTEECLEYYKGFLKDKPRPPTPTSCPGPISSWKPLSLGEYSISYTTPQIRYPKVRPPLEMCFLPPKSSPTAFLEIECPEQIFVTKRIREIGILIETSEPPKTKKKPKTPPIPMT